MKRLRNPRLFCLLLILAASFVWSGCAKTETAATTAAGGIDLTDKLFPIHPADPELKVNRNFAVVRNGVRKNSLALVAPVLVRASLQGASGKQLLEGLATPVFNIGDGIRIDLYLNRAGVRRAIGNRYFDSGRRGEDRAWISIAFPVDLHKEDQLEIDVSAGPQGDLVADWLAFSSLRLVPREIAP